MKNIITIFILLFGFVGANAQTFVVTPSVDTISTSSSLDTVTFTLLPLYSAVNYELQVSADSLSGGTTATCYLQVNQDMAGTDWYNLKTVTIDGVQTRAFETGSLVRGTVRCRCLAPSSTQSTAVRVSFAAKRQ